MSKSMKDRILDNQKEHHELLVEYYTITEQNRANNAALDMLRQRISQITGKMLFVDESRKGMKQQDETTNIE